MPDRGGSVDGFAAPTDGVVLLRPLSRSDAPFLARASHDDDIARYSLPHDRDGNPQGPISLAEAATTIDGFAAGWRAYMDGGCPSAVAFAITDAGSGELAGVCGVDDWNAEDVAQVGYWLAPEARGNGYATRALVLLTEWLFELGAARVFLTIVDGNGPSIAVARRAGFIHEGTMRSHAMWRSERCDVLWFAALRAEWVVRR